jgi:DNA-binding response OmpR family regulator
MKRVLIVDDDPGVRTLSGVALKSAGFDVTTAGDGREALDILDRTCTDVIVLDLNMPVMDGRTFFHTLEHDRHRPHVLIVSADKAESAKRELGADASLEKPFLPDELIEKVSELTSTSN